MARVPADPQLEKTQSEPPAFPPGQEAEPDSIGVALRTGGDLRAAVAQAYGIVEESAAATSAPGAPGGGSSDDDSEGGPRLPRAPREAVEDGRATATDRRQMFGMIQSYYKADHEKFHGRDDENVEEFLETYESLFSIAGMPLSLAAEMLPYVVAGAAKDFVRMRSPGLTWTGLRSLLLSQYASAARRQRLTQRYQALCQQSPSGLDSYYRQLIDLSRQLPPAYRMPDLMRDKFISGIHESIREAVTLVDPPTLQAAYDRAKLVMQARRTRLPATHRVPRRPPWKKPAGSPRRTHQGGDRMMLSLPDSRTARATVICWECGGAGHTRSAHRAGAVRTKPDNGRENEVGRQH